MRRNWQLGARRLRLCDDQALQDLLDLQRCGISVSWPSSHKLHSVTGRPKERGSLAAAASGLHPVTEKQLLTTDGVWDAGLEPDAAIEGACQGADSIASAEVLQDLRELEHGGVSVIWPGSRCHGRPGDARFADS